MSGVQMLLDLLLAGLLLATLVRAVRLERALRRLQGEHGALGDTMDGLQRGTTAAQDGIARLRALADDAAGGIARQAELGGALKEDLAFLMERGDRLADRMEALVRAAQPIAGAAARPAAPPVAQLPTGGSGRVRSQAERDLLQALRATR